MPPPVYGSLCNCGNVFLDVERREVAETLEISLDRYWLGVLLCVELVFLSSGGIVVVVTRLLVPIPHSRKYSECKLLPTQPNYSLAQGAFESPSALYDWPLSRFPNHKRVRLYCILYL